jgi:hypothetical protein
VHERGRFQDRVLGVTGGMPGVMKLLGDWNWYLPGTPAARPPVPSEPVSGT